MDKATQERFWAKVNVAAADDCWEWQASTSKNGYGCFKVDGRVEGAHRFAFFLVNDRYPAAGNVVRHSCDNIRCVNPKHLTEGSKSENYADFLERGSTENLGRHGAANGHAKLTAEQVAEIRSRISRGETNVKIAKDFRVGHAAVSKIRTSKSWAIGPQSVRRPETDAKSRVSGTEDYSIERVS